MADDITRAEARAIADGIMGYTRPTLHDLIDQVAANAPDVEPDAPGLPPAGDDDELQELTSGCPDNGEQHNPWSRD
jgi:hypothetical protein